MKRRASDIIAVSVVTPAYAHLRVEAVRRVETFLAMPVHIIECADKDAFRTKLNLDSLCPRKRIVFCDVDWWAIRPIDFSGWDGTAWMAVHDPGVFHPRAFPMTDCHALGIRPEMYFNSGFFCFDNSRQAHRAVFKRAREIEHAVFTGRLPQLGDFGDQSLLNAGVQGCKVPVNMLPFSYNYMRYMVEGRTFLFTPAEVHAVHAAGYPLADKLRHLQVAAEFLGYPLDEPRAEAIAWHHQRALTMA